MNSKNWDSGHIADQKGRVVVVTGASSGIGWETARVISNKKAEVVLAVRNEQKGIAAAQKIKDQNKDAVVKVMVLDLADLHSVKNFAEEFKKKFSKLDLLINNAGVMIPPYSKTADGFELQMGTNHLGHFALTGRLIELMKNVPNSRIVNVSSNAHKLGKIDFDDLNWEKRKYKTMRSYADSKIANLYFTYALKEKIAKSGLSIKVTAAHPGWTATNLQRHAGFFEFLNPYLAQTIKMGALPTLRAATDKEANSGDYFGPCGWQGWRGYPVKIKSNKISKDEKIAQKLWDVSEELTAVKFDFGKTTSMR